MLRRILRVHVSICKVCTCVSTAMHTSCCSRCTECKLSHGFVDLPCIILLIKSDPYQTLSSIVANVVQMITNVSDHQYDIRVKVYGQIYINSGFLGL